MNGNETGQKYQSAREMTAEIEQATNSMIESQEAARIREIARSQAGNLGSKVLTYNPELNQTEQQKYNEERVRQIAETDAGYNPSNVNSEDLIGVETKVQVNERIEEDKEDIANEQGLNGQYVKAIMDRNNKRITKETVASVDSLISKNEYRPGQLDQLTNRARTDFLKDVFNRILGSRN